MKNNILKTLLIFILIVYSCNKNDDCEITDLVAESIEAEYGCPDTRFELQVDLVNNYLIIRSQQDFENKVSGSCIPNIDFSSFDLVIGKKGLSSGNTSIDYKLTKNCSNLLKLQVTFIQNDATEAPNVTYHALVPKLGDEETVAVEFAYNN